MNALKWLNGVKTLLFFGLMILSSVLQVTEAFDFTPVVEFTLGYFFPEAHISTAQAIALLSLAGILLRTVTNGPTLKGWLSPEKTGVDEGA